MAEETIFSKIINREIPADIVYEDEKALAFKDINPQAPVHLLIIPKEPIATVNDVDEENAHLVGHLYVVASKLAVQYGCNEHGGQTVYHIHLHLLAGKPLGWPPYTDTLKQG